MALAAWRLKALGNESPKVVYRYCVGLIMWAILDQQHGWPVKR